MTIMTGLDESDPFGLKIYRAAFVPPYHVSSAFGALQIRGRTRVARGRQAKRAAKEEQITLVFVFSGLRVYIRKQAADCKTPLGYLIRDSCSSKASAFRQRQHLAVQLRFFHGHGGGDRGDAGEPPAAPPAALKTQHASKLHNKVAPTTTSTSHFSSSAVSSSGGNDDSKPSSPPQADAPSQEPSREASKKLVSGRRRSVRSSRSAGARSSTSTSSSTSCSSSSGGGRGSVESSTGGSNNGSQDGACPIVVAGRLRGRAARKCLKATAAWLGALMPQSAGAPTSADSAVAAIALLARGGRRRRAPFSGAAQDARLQAAAAKAGGSPGEGGPLPVPPGSVPGEVGPADAAATEAAAAGTTSQQPAASVRVTAGRRRRGGPRQDAADASGGAPDVPLGGAINYQFPVLFNVAIKRLLKPLLRRAGQQHQRRPTTRSTAAAATATAAAGPRSPQRHPLPPCVLMRSWRPVSKASFLSGPRQNSRVRQQKQQQQAAQQQLQAQKQQQQQQQASQQQVVQPDVVAPSVQQPQQQQQQQQFPHETPSSAAQPQAGDVAAEVMPPAVQQEQEPQATPERKELEEKVGSTAVPEAAAPTTAAPPTAATAAAAAAAAADTDISPAASKPEGSEGKRKVDEGLKVDADLQASATAAGQQEQQEQQQEQQQKQQQEQQHEPPPPTKVAGAASAAGAARTGGVGRVASRSSAARRSFQMNYLRQQADAVYGQLRQASSPYYLSVSEWMYNNGNVIVTVGSLLSLTATLMADMRLLRAFNLLAGLCYFSYNWSRRPRLADAALWNVVFLVLNIVMLYRVQTEHREVAFSPQELDIFQRYFLPAGMSPRQFRRLLKQGVWRTLPQGFVLQHEACNCDTLCFVVRGTVEISQGGQLVETYRGGETGAVIGIEPFLSYLAALRSLRATKKSAQAAPSAPPETLASHADETPDSLQQQQQQRQQQRKKQPQLSAKGCEGQFSSNSLEQPRDPPDSNNSTTAAATDHTSAVHAGSAADGEVKQQQQQQQQQHKPLLPLFKGAAEAAAAGAAAESVASATKEAAAAGNSSGGLVAAAAEAAATAAAAVRTAAATALSPDATVARPLEQQQRAGDVAPPAAAGAATTAPQGEVQVSRPSAAVAEKQQQQEEATAAAAPSKTTAAAAALLPAAMTPHVGKTQKPGGAAQQQQQQQHQQHQQHWLSPLGRREEEELKRRRAEDEGVTAPFTATCTTEATVFSLDIRDFAAFVSKDPENLGFPVVQGLTTLIVNRSRAQAAKIALHSYDAFLAGVFADGVVQTDERKLLEEFRKKRAISQAQHEEALARLGWTPEEFERGSQGGSGMFTRLAAGLGALMRGGDPQEATAPPGEDAYQQRRSCSTSAAPDGSVHAGTSGLDEHPLFEIVGCIYSTVHPRSAREQEAPDTGIEDPLATLGVAWITDLHVQPHYSTESHPDVRCMEGKSTGSSKHAEFNSCMESDLRIGRVGCPSPPLLATEALSFLHNLICSTTTCATTPQDQQRGAPDQEGALNPSLQAAKAALRAHPLPPIKSVVLTGDYVYYPKNTEEELVTDWSELLYEAWRPALPDDERTREAEEEGDLLLENDPAGQFAWLEDELKTARSLGQRVSSPLVICSGPMVRACLRITHKCSTIQLYVESAYIPQVLICGHILPGVTARLNKWLMVRSNWEESFALRDLISRCSDIVVAQLFGHEHDGEVRALLPPKVEASIPQVEEDPPLCGAPQPNGPTAILTCPSLTPVDGNNPAVRVLVLEATRGTQTGGGPPEAGRFFQEERNDQLAFRLADYVQYRLPLYGFLGILSSEKGNLPVFVFEYSFQKTFGPFLLPPQKEEGGGRSQREEEGSSLRCIDGSTALHLLKVLNRSSHAFAIYQHHRIAGGLAVPSPVLTCSSQCVTKKDTLQCMRRP
ncbi:hypothetical protein ACSSS7_002147 [Eimeria intestinalis]